jgi:tripeptide aminopeptidase
VKGLASHAGVSPEKGISAIQIASAAIAAMKLGRVGSETTANIGSINGGGQTNIVCDKVEIKAEARSLDNKKLEEQTSHMKECFEKAAAEFGGSVDFKAVLEYSAFNMSTDAKIMSILQKAARDVNIELLPEETGGGSDTNIFNAKGIESVNISVGMKQVHSVDENILIDDMVLAAEFLLSIIQNIC